MHIPNLYPILLCGGNGTRLRPLGADGTPPKPFHDLTGAGESVLQQAARRGLAVAPAAHVLTLTAAPWGETARTQLAALDPALARGVITEPSAKNTAAAMALAVQCVLARDERAVLWAMPTDHAIGDTAALASQVRRVAAEASGLVLFGVTPEGAEDGFGYMRAAPKQAGEESSLWPVSGFVEKPPREEAARLTASGEWYWNSGMFMGPGVWFREAFSMHAPEVWCGVEAALRAGLLKTPVPHAALEQWETLPALPFDTAIVERCASVTMIKLTSSWADLGTWERVEKQRKLRAAG